MPTERLDKIVASHTRLSRAEAKAALKEGRVIVDGKAVRDGAMKFDPASAEIKLDGAPLVVRSNVYLMLHKPAGYVTSTEERGQRSVLELVGEDFSHYDLFPAGRLDKDTEGFLILTTDGDFCHRVISPKTDTVKCYYLKTADPMLPEDAAELAKGVVLKDGTKCRPARLDIGPSDTEALIYITEGKYHEVRRLLASCGNLVTYLKRLSIGGVELDPNLMPGEYRELTLEEINAISGA